MYILNFIVTKSTDISLTSFNLFHEILTIDPKKKTSLFITAFIGAADNKRKIRFGHPLSVIFFKGYSFPEWCQCQVKSPVTVPIYLIFYIEPFSKSTPHQIYHIGTYIEVLERHVLLTANLDDMAKEELRARCPSQWIYWLERLIAKPCRKCVRGSSGRYKKMWLQWKRWPRAKKWRK